MTGGVKRLLLASALGALSVAGIAAGSGGASAQAEPQGVAIPLPCGQCAIVQGSLPPLVVTPPPPRAVEPLAVPLADPPAAPLAVPLAEPPAAPLVEAPAVIAAPVARECAPLPNAVCPPPAVEVVEVPVIPKLETPPAEVKPPVVATPVSRAAPPKPALSEIIMEGPKAQDATAALTAALAEAKASYAKVRDYSGHLIIQERVRGTLEAEITAELRYRASPASTAVKVIAPSALVGREIAFVSGRGGNKARVKAAGTYGPLAYANLAVSDHRALVTSRHSVLDVGIGPIIERIERSLEAERKLRHTVYVTAADFQFAGKTVTRFEIHCPQPHALRDAARLVVCIDPDHKLPVRLEVHDGGDAGNADLREVISLVNLSFNQYPGEAFFEK